MLLVVVMNRSDDTKWMVISDGVVCVVYDDMECSYMARSVLVVISTLVGAYFLSLSFNISSYDFMMEHSYMARSVVIVRATLAGADLWSSQNDIHETHTLKKLYSKYGK